MRKRIFIFAVFSVFSFVALMFIFPVIKSPQNKAYEGESSTYEEILSLDKRSMVCGVLPKGSTKISYRVMPYLCLLNIDFSISFEEFLKWAEENDWDVPSSGCISVVIGCRTGEENILIRNGVSIEVVSRMNAADKNIVRSLRVVFDLDRSRCYYRYVGDGPPRPW